MDSIQCRNCGSCSHEVEKCPYDPIYGKGEAREKAKALANPHPITAPSHYTRSSIQPVDVIRAWDLDYFTGSCLKYLCRFRYKGTPVEDIKKAKRFLEMWLEDNDDG